ncbi:MAG: DUF917 domain-containing protein [Chloroflexota bacterium]|nr:DUF917 domain-containing protein [Chloroflexota bacterium]
MNGVRTETELGDFLRGTNFLSASGGGEPDVQAELLLDDLARGLTLSWTPLDEIADDALICTACFSGSIAPETFTDSPEADQIAGPERIRRPMVASIQALERELGRKIDGICSIEIGGINTSAVLDAAANLGIAMVDGDYAGRAIPELHATTPHLFGVQVLPWASVDEYGNEIVIRRAASNAFAERIGKHLALASFGLIGCALVALPASEVRRIYVPGTITESLAVGRAIREARDAGGDPVQAAAQALNGWVLFRGSIVSREWRNTGYLEGTHEIEGEGDFAGHRLKLWFKNENHLSWLDGADYVASPDLIEVCDATTGEPLVNTYLEEGDRVAVVAAQRRDVWDSPAGLATLGPAHFGWNDFTFRGIESLAGDRA